MPKKPSYLEVLQKRRRDTFVGRVDQRRAFRNNFASDIPAHLIFFIHGLAGIGKSFLLARYQDIARQNGAITALTNEAEATATKHISILQAMARLARQLRDSGSPLKAFDRRYASYRTAMLQIEADDDPPPEWFDFLTRTTARVAMHAGAATPDGPTAAIPSPARDALANAAAAETGRVLAYLRKTFKNDPDLITLIREPVETLTFLLAQSLNRIAGDQPVVLCFDTWERTGPHLDDWLRGLLTREGLSTGVRLVIAGRNPPGDQWGPLDPLVVCFELHEFTPEETREYLSEQRITEEARIQQIIDFSGGVPVLVSTLASARGGSATDAADDLVDRYLKWVDDDSRRYAALNCAAARRLDKDVVAAVTQGDDAGDLFDWLVDMPFVQTRPDYWEYHPTVRHLMLDYARRRSTKDAKSTHAQLSAYYKQLLSEGGEEPRYRDEMWRRHALEALYHGLMQDDTEAQREGLNTFLLALRAYYPLAGQVALTWQQAADNCETAANVTKWADILGQGWAALETASWDGLLPFRDAMHSRDDLAPSPRAEIYFIGGIAYADLEQHERAIADYDRAIELNPRYATAYHNRGIACSNLEEYERAIADYDRAIELSSQEPAAYRNRGIAYADLKQYQQAIADYERAIELNPEDATAYHNRGLAYRNLKEYERAVADYDQAIELNPEDATAYHNRGSAYGNLQEYQRAIADYERAIELNPEYAAAYHNRGSAYGNLEDYERAIADFNRAIELNLEDATAYHNRGLAYRNLKEYERAVADYDQAIELNPEDATAYHNRGSAYGNLQEYQRAIADYERAIELNPEYAAAYHNRGSAYGNLEDYERAIADFNRAIELNPEDATAYHNRGIAYGNLEDYERAIADFDRAIELNPEYATAYYNRGAAYAHLEDYERAIADYDRAIELNPKDATAYNNRGIAYAHLEDYERAIADFDRAVELNPDDFGVYNNRGIAYDGLKQYERAIEDYDRVIELKPEYATAYYNKACAYALIGKPTEACDWLEKALAIDESGRDDARQDSDFDPIRGHPRFRALVGDQP